MTPREITRLGLLAALAIAIYAIESVIPKPFPWLRLGLSNAFILTVLLVYGLGLALSVSVVRTLLGSILVGSFLNPGFAIAILAGVTSCLVMGVTRHLGGRHVGTVGLSILGATAHNLTQLGVAYLLFIRRPEIFMLLPVFLVLSAGTGILTGLVAHYLLLKLRSPVPAVN
jgi:heptaprenyl diphosphate synthase